MKTLMLLFAVLACTLADETMINLAHKDPTLLRAMFRNFQHDAHRHYANRQEERTRLKNFKHFVDEMAVANDEPDGVEYGLTFFADLSEAEAEQYYGFGNQTHRESAEVGEEGPQPEKRELRERAASVSHKERFWPAKNQGRCGSCWAFTTVAMLEGWSQVVTGNKAYLSEQQVLDCSGDGNNCKGGWFNEALNEIKRNKHLAAGWSYKYDWTRYSCRRSSHKNALPIEIFGVYHEEGGESMMEYRLSQGPLGIAVDFKNPKFKGYWRGIWTDTTQYRGYATHAMALTGYTSSYWEIRNSWGDWWGEDGYIRMTRSVPNVLLIAKHAWYISAGKPRREEELEVE